jgi:predicted amidophosphoribosyltransferase
VAEQGQGVTSEPSHGACAYCLWRFTADPEEVLRVCPTCSTPYHSECFEENGGCATFGCPSWVSAQQAAGRMPQMVTPALPQPIPSVAPSQSAPVSQQPAADQSSQRANFCAQCGNALEPTYQFCAACGQPVRG